MFTPKNLKYLISVYTGRLMIIIVSRYRWAERSKKSARWRYNLFIS